MNPQFPPGIEIAVVILAEFIFGWLYDALISWAESQEIYEPYVSFSVVLGVLVTIAIPTGLWWARPYFGWQWAILLVIAFIGSGAMMIVGSLQRNAKNSHKRRPWPTAARHARDDVVMDLSAMASEATLSAERGEITPALIVRMVHRLHQAIGILKSV